MADKNNRPLYGVDGQSMGVIATKDSLGFDHEVLDTVFRNQGFSTTEIKNVRRKKNKAAGILDGTTDKRAKAKVTLPKFSWDK